MPENEDNLLFDSVEFGGDFLTIDESGDLLNTPNDKKEEEKKSEIETSDLITVDNSETDSNNLESDDKTPVVNATTSSSPLSNVVTVLGEELGIEVDNDALEKAEDKGQFLRDLFNKAVEDKATAHFTPEQLEAYEAAKLGVPLAEVVNTKGRKASYAALKEENIKENTSLQEVLIKNSLLTRGFSEVKADEMINDFKTIGEAKVLKEALEAKDFMVQKEAENEKALIEQAKANKVKEEESKIQTLEKVKTFVKSQTQVIPNVPLTDKVKDEVLKSMTTAVAKDEYGNALNKVGTIRAKDPVRFEFLLNYYTSLGLFNETPDFSKFEKAAATKQAKGLDKLLNETGDISNGKSKQVKADTDGLGLGVFN